MDRRRRRLVGMIRSARSLARRALVVAESVLATGRTQLLLNRTILSELKDLNRRLDRLEATRMTTAAREPKGVELN